MTDIELVSATRIKDLWQSYECPQGTVNFDLSGDHMVLTGEKFDCSHCRGQHTAGSDVDVQLHVCFGDDGLSCWPLPANVYEKAALLAMIGTDVVVPGRVQALHDVFLATLERSAKVRAATFFERNLLNPGTKGLALQRDMAGFMELLESGHTETNVCLREKID